MASVLFDTVPAPVAADQGWRVTTAYWQDNGGVTDQDPDEREVVFASWNYREPQS